MKANTLEIRQILLDTLTLYDEAPKPMSEELLKLFIEASEDRLEALITAARIDELEKARSVDSQLSSADIVDHLEKRLAQLKER